MTYFASTRMSNGISELLGKVLLWFGWAASEQAVSAED